MQEHWKIIRSHPSYEISNLGTVRRRVARYNIPAGHIMKTQIMKSGYETICLYRDGKVKTLYVHRVVAKEFLLRPSSEKNIVNHINGDKSNNRAENLHYVSQSDNMKHAVEFGLIRVGEKSSTSKLKRNQVLEIRAMYKAGGHTHAAIAKIFNVSRKCIFDILNRKSWKHL